MKKLIMFITVAALAVVGYSAEVQWGTGNNWIKNKDGSNLAKNTDIMLIMASDASAVSSALAAGTSINSYVLDSAKTSNTKGYVAVHEASNSKPIVLCWGHGKWSNSNVFRGLRENGLAPKR